ncbi:HIT family protein [Halosimplex amylolyticum]|uniref:HIT family protein n=1 Tax=Halosimplex amylolyticum TaxID=3396616 RepID=UPI003F56FF19
MDDCAFCRIVDGGRDVYTLFEGERTLAFLDENPATAGHSLVVPRDHVEDLLLADEATTTAVFRTARALALAMDRALEPDGFSAFHTTGGLVGRVEHAHLHLLPRYADDDIRLSLSRGSLDDTRPESIAESLRSSL